MPIQKLGFATPDVNIAAIAERLRRIEQILRDHIEKSTEHDIKEGYHTFEYDDAGKETRYTIWVSSKRQIKRYEETYYYDGDDLVQKNVVYYMNGKVVRHLLISYTYVAMGMIDTKEVKVI